MNEPVMNEKTRRVVIAAVDGSDTDHHVLAAACEQLPPDSDSVLVLAHVVDVGTIAAPIAQQLREEGHALLASRVAEAGARVTNAHVLRRLMIGEAAGEVLGLAEELAADIIVVGSHGRRGVSRLLLGSVAESVVRRATCPVLVARPKATPMVPTIEPPCVDCTNVRRDSGGAITACARHAHPHPRAHTFHSAPDSMAPSSGLNGMK